MGAWIETLNEFTDKPFGFVAPYVGAWIETKYGDRQEAAKTVAPYVGAWIETTSFAPTYDELWSHPMWVRGLKLDAQIENVKADSRTLCGCVD